MEHKSICRHLLQGPLEGKVRKCTYICRHSVARLSLLRCFPHPFKSLGCEKATTRGKRKSASLVSGLRIFAAGSISLKFFIKFLVEEEILCFE